MKMKNKNILIFTYFGTDKPGGVQSIIKSIINNTPDVNFGIFALGEKKFKKTTQKGVKSFTSPLLKRGKKVKEKEVKKLLQKVYSEFKPDIVHCHNASYMFDPDLIQIFFNFFKEKGIPLIEHAHHANIRRKDIVEKSINLEWDKIIVVSKFAYNRIAPTVEDPNKIEIVPNCVNRDVFSPRTSEQKNKWKEKLNIKKKFVFAFPSRTIRISTGEIGKQKQFKTVLKALSLLKKQGFDNFCLLVTNLGDYHKKEKVKNKFKKVIKQFNLLDNLKIFPEKLKQKEMYKFYTPADIILFPSLKESFGLITLEGMAMGIPVIGARSGGIEKIIEDKEDGILVEPKNFKELTNKIKLLIDNPDLYNRIVKNGLKKAESYCSRKYVKTIKSLWKEVI